tara:strand:- start:4 stop:669 length:666 start_codon:yes stop_codon:yes gene_type:complete
MLGLGNSLVSGSVSSEVTVSDISGLAHWYQYQTGATLDSTNITQWNDQVGSNHLSKSGSANIPYNNGDIDFDQNGGKMTFASTFDPGSFSFYIVFKINGTVANEEIANSNSSNFFRLNNASTIRIRIGDTTNNDISLSSSLSADTFHAVGIEWDGTNIAIYNSAGSAIGTATDSDTFAGLSSIGLRGNQFDGHIREIILFNNELTAADRTVVFNRLNVIKS